MDKPPPSSAPVTYYSWPQHLAQTVLAAVLRDHLPHSNPLYNRILAPQNTPSRHCLFAATFSPSAAPPTVSKPYPFTILFSDRSRHHEAQIWLFNPLTAATSLDAEQSNALASHVYSALQFLRNTPIPAAPGWPFSSVLKLASVPTAIAECVKAIALPSGALVHDTNWTHYLIPLAGDHSAPPLPVGFKTSPVPDNQLDLVISTSGIPRQADTLRTQPCSAVLDPDGKLAAWAYMDIAGSLATLYVVPEHRGKGFARAVAGDLLEKLHKGEFGNLSNGTSDGGGLEKDKSLMPFGQGSGWVSAEVKDGNRGSEKVVEGLGGKRYGNTRYMFIECDLLP